MNYEAVFQEIEGKLNKHNMRASSQMDAFRDLEDYGVMI